MELLQLRCYLAVAETLHFGKAAQQLDMLPASLSRHIKLLEDSLGTTLIARTTRHVSLTAAGLMLLEDAKDLIDRSDALEEKARLSRSSDAQVLRVGAIDSVAAGMMPELLHYFGLEHPDIKITLMEQKTIRLLPRLLSGRLDVAFVRPPETRNPKLVFRPLFSETAVVAMPSDHPLAKRDMLQIGELVDQPLIVPDRRSRPHSHDLTIKLFLEAGLSARVAQVAEEKQTIVNIVSAGLGLAIVPRWTMRLQVQGVTFVPIDLSGSSVRDKLALAVTWVRGTNDPLREALLDTLARHQKQIAKSA
ncbi:LysR family transcriptional regulator [Pelagibacterium xiamenense]|uniref:LysR family transcriptional regulator n=1 Tax=Pelagibacterium xiamenense TaxID=2901140 RepID=UPI001E3FF383|nr:LysR family transcriptional regulator [Pelagibacterium xiamenense]